MEPSDPHGGAPVAPDRHAGSQAVDGHAGSEANDGHAGSEANDGHAGSEGIDRRHYEESGYFLEGGSHLLDPNSAFHRYRVREVLALCGPLDGRRVVDLGCGWGTLSFAIAREARVVVGVDFAEAALRICHDRRQAEPSPNLHFICADAGKTALEAGLWDLVVAADLVEHLYPEDTRRVYREAARLLRPGGRFVVWTPNPGHLLEVLRHWGWLRADPTHVDYKVLERVVSELETVGFRTISSGYVPSHLPVLRMIERLLQRWVPALRRRIAVVAELPPPNC